MAKEGNLGVARALDTDLQATKADLQSRMGEAREHVTEPVVEQNHALRESVPDVLDWRGQVRRHPVVWSLGALGLGIIVGYGLVELIEGDDELVDESGSEQVNPVIDGYESVEAGVLIDQHSNLADARAISRVDTEHVAREQAKPGIIGRFKETRAYYRLQDEVADLGNRFMDELSTAARTVVLPALFNKLKEMIGVDLSNKQRSGGDAAKPSASGPITRASKPTPGDVQDPAISQRVPHTRSEIGKPAYPHTTESTSKFDRLGGDSNSPAAQVDTSPHINLNYDDRYERESKLFSRSEIRGFAPEKPGENKAPTPESRSTGSDDVPRGGDYIYDAGRTDNN